jgi:PAS domain S-box-containing protein
MHAEKAAKAVRAKESSEESRRTLERQVEERFGVLPNFFRLAPQTPEITANLWAFANFAYLDNPLPSVFKERLFVYLSRFCTVRYCIARHVGFLLGLGRSAGDAQARVLSVADIVQLLRRPFARGPQLKVCLSLATNCPAPLAEMPSADSQVEDWIFAFATHVFLQTADGSTCLDELERLLGPVRLQYLLLLLAFVRAAHYWTKVHPEIAFEEDIKRLLQAQEGLADCILNDPEASSGGVTESILEELAALRPRADRATSLLSAIVDNTDDAIISETLDGVINGWNPGAERLFGYDAKEAVGQHISLIIPNGRSDEERTVLERVRRGERLGHFDTVRVGKDGRAVDVSVTVSPIRDGAGRIAGVSKIARDITDRVKAERELRESEQRLRILADALDIQVQFRTLELQRRATEIAEQSEQLRDLSARLLQSQDQERRHIARELHDSAGQTLAVLSMQITKLGSDAEQHPHQVRAVARELQGMVEQLTQEIRTTSYLLHPPTLDECGLSSALGWYAEGLAQRSGLEIHLEIQEDFERLPSETELAIFRFVQECLTNIHRHSESKSATIRLGRDAEKISVEVQDRGKGMSRERLSEVRSRSTGLGVRGMQERIRQLRGEFVIESNSLGTKVSAVLPIPQEPARKQAGMTAG